MKFNQCLRKFKFKYKFILFLFICLSIIVLNYYRIYRLKSISSIEKSIIENFQGDKNVKIINSLDIENLKICLLNDKKQENQNYVLTATLQKGLNGRFKVNCLTKYGFKDKLIIKEINKKTYIIYVGYNDKNLQNKTVGLDINTKKLYFTFDIKDKKNFIKYKKIDVPKKYVQLIYFK